MNVLTLLSILFLIVFVGVIVYIVFFASTFYVANKMNDKRKNKKNAADQVIISSMLRFSV